MWHSESHDEEEEEDAEDDDEDDEGDEAEEAGEENDRPYNLRQRKTVQRYEAPPIGINLYLLLFFYLIWLISLNHVLSLDMWLFALCLISQSLWTENRATPHFLTPTGLQQEEAI